MTLNWNQTASDFRLMQAIGPDLIRIHDARDGILTNAEFRQALQPLIRKLPQVMFWERTRHRASTLHGCYQIRQAFRDWVRGRWETHKDLPGDYRTLAEPGL